MSDDAVIVAVAVLTATACGLLGPFLVLRRTALLADAVSHAVLPGIVAVWVIGHTRAPLPVVAGAAAFAVVCVLAVDALRRSGLVASDAAIALTFPALFSLGVLGVTRYADGVHLDLDATVYGEIALVPFTTVTIGGIEVARALVVLAVVAAVDAALIALTWKELAAATFDPDHAAAARLRPRLLARSIVVAVAVTAVAAFEAVGAILVVTLLIVPAATASLVTRRLWHMVAVSVAVGWVGAVAGHRLATALDSSVAGAMGLACTACLVVAVATRAAAGSPTLRRTCRRVVSRGARSRGSPPA